MKRLDFISLLGGAAVRLPWQTHQARGGSMNGPTTYEIAGFVTVALLLGLVLVLLLR